MSQYIIYCRKSTESEERQILSIESQVKELKELAERLNLEVSEILTESQSAKYPGRPIFNGMMKKVYTGKLKGIIAWKLDRLARNPIDGSALVWALDRGEIQEIVTPTTTFKDDSNAKFLMQLEFGMAKKYVDDLGDNVKRGNRAKLDKGWLPGLPPLGYLNAPEERTIIKDPDRFPLVRKMWDLLFQGVSPYKILSIANDEWGFRTRTFKKSGNNPLSTSGLYYIFGNPFYYGLIERKEGVFIGKHEPMITEEEYWRAQEVLGRKGRPRPKSHNFAFTGLIRCAECGCMVTAEEKDNRYGYHYVYYRCTKKKRGTLCRQKYINAKDLENQIGEFLEKIHVPERLLNLALDYLREEEKNEAENHLAAQKSLTKALNECQRKLSNLNQMRFTELIDDQEYVTEKRKLLGEKLRLERKAKSQDWNGKQSLERTKRAFIFAHEAKDRFKNGDSQDKRSILMEIGSNFSLRDKRLLIEAEKPFALIEKGLRPVRSENLSLEPQSNGLVKGETRLSLPVIQYWSALMDDVRTFFEQKLGGGTASSLSG